MSASLALVCAVSFAALFALALAALTLPGQRRRDSAKRARLAEVGRYRVLGASGPTAPGAGPDRVGAAVRPTLDRLLGLTGRWVEREGRRARLTDQLEKAGLRLRPEEWVAIVVSAVAGAAVFGLLLLGIGGALAGGVLAWLGCVAFRRWRTGRRRRAFEQHLPDALQLIASSLRAGLAMATSMTTLTQEGLEPVSSEFARALQEMRLGATLEEALDGVATRTGSEDMTLVAVAVRTAREVGGNLAEVLQSTADTMRERAEVRGQVRTLSAESRFSAKVLTALPLLMAAYLVAFRRAYLHPLYSTGIGIALLSGGITLLLAGTFWLSRLTRIEV